MKKRIPYSVSDFRQINSGDYYYVDKTRYIEDLENWNVPLFLRPKRFGKSLWCSTLAYYYDINFRDEFEQLFSNTYIGQHPTRSHSTYAVMSLSFASIDTSGSVEDIRRSFNDCCHNQYVQFIRRYPDVRLNEENLPDDAIAALGRILACAASNKLPPLYVIIDEYDNFTNSILTAHGMDDYFAVTTGDSFLRVFYKAIKEAVGNGTVGRVFMTGVLPVTLDDMTSGFNIAMNASLDDGLAGMIGFTQQDVETLVSQIFADYGLSSELQAVVLNDLKENYDGYRMISYLPDTLYNSTICNYYLFNLLQRRSLPTRKFDPNLKLDRHWIGFLASSPERSAEILMTAMGEGRIPFSDALLDEQINAMSIREDGYIPLLLYYLGVLTWNDATSLRVPNQNQLVLLSRYCSDLQRWKCPDVAMNSALAAFLDNHDMASLFAVFWDGYIGLIPAAAFTHLCENFYRTSFFMLCKPNMPKGMDADIEQNTHSGRYDMRFWGYGLPWWDTHTVLLEFKYRKGDQPLPPAPLPDDIGQIHAYAADQRLLHPEKQMLQSLVYIRGHEEWRMFKMDT